MNRLIALCLLLVACNNQSTADLQKEYDSIIVEQKRVGESIDFFSMGVNASQGLDDDSNLATYSKVVDSLNIRKEQLEKRRQELARQLYQ